MSEEEVQDIDVDAELAAMTSEQPTPAPDPEPAPTEETATDDTLKTDAQKWRDYLIQFKDADEARAHVKQKALETGWATGTGYRAVKQIKKWKTKTKAKELTFKFKKVDLPDPEPDIDPTPPPAPYNPPPTPNPPPPPAQTQTYQTPISYDAQQQLQGVIERHVGKCVNNVADIVGMKFGILDGDSPFLDHTDQQDLAILLPFIIADITKQGISPEQTKQTAYYTFAGSLVTKAIKNRLNKPEKPAPKPKPEPQQEQPTPAPEPAKPKQPAQETNTRDSKVGWLRELPS